MPKGRRRKSRSRAAAPDGPIPDDGSTRTRQQLLTALGLAARAGRLLVGLAAVERAVRRGEARAVVIPSDAPDHVARKLTPLLRNGSLLHKLVVDGNRLGRAVGRDRVLALAVTDDSLGRRVRELADAGT